MNIYSVIVIIPEDIFYSNIPTCSVPAAFGSWGIKILYSDFNISFIIIPAAVSPKIPGIYDILP